MNSAMKLAIHHTTHYRFTDTVKSGLQQIRKTPRNTAHQQVLNWTTEVTGGQRDFSYDDHHGNRIDLVSFDSELTELTVVSHGEVEVADNQGIVGPHRGPAPLWLYRQATDRTAVRKGVRELLASLTSGNNTLDQLHELSHRIRKVVSYEIGASKSHWTAEEALSAGVGVCQDHAHIFIACARHMDIPARYVSGYLMLDEQTTQTAMHAWAEAYVEDLGWVGDRKSVV